jgi:hypothetical protein
MPRTVRLSEDESRLKHKFTITIADADLVEQRPERQTFTKASLENPGEHERCPSAYHRGRLRERPRARLDDRNGGPSKAGWGTARPTSWRG